MGVYASCHEDNAHKLSDQADELMMKMRIGEEFAGECHWKDVPIEHATSAGGLYCQD